MRRSAARRLILWCGVLFTLPACGDDGGGGGPDARDDAGTDGDADAADVPVPTELVILSERAVAVTTTSAVLSWYTFVPATSQAEYGPTAAWGTTTPEDAGPVQDHRVRVEGLAPDTEYHFRVHSRAAGVGEGVSEDRTFRTLPESCAGGDAFHVDAAAAAGGDGRSWATAWTGPEEIDMTALGPGDCVFLRAGTYDGQLRVRAAGAEGSPLSFLPAGPVVLRGGVTVDEEQHDVVLRGFELTWGDPTTRGPGVDLEGDRVEFFENYLHHTSGIGSGGDGNRVHHNLVWFAEGVAMYVAGANSSLEANDVSHSTCFFAGDADASRFFGTDNALRDNFFHDVLDEDSPGCNPHCDCFQTYAVNPGEVAHRITIEGNYCYNICGQMFMGEGILADDTHADITFRRNVFERVGAVAMNAGGIRNLRLEHNTFVGGGLSAVGLSDVPGAAVVANLFWFNPHAYGCDGCEADYNLIWPHDCFFDDPFVEPHGLHRVDPLLIAPANHDFRPAPGSPACGAGPDGGDLGALPCDPVTACWDLDGDGYGRPTSSFCAHPEPDCDDGDEQANPGLAEACDGRDNDCDGLVDEDCAELQPVLALHFDGTADDASDNAFAVRGEGTAPSFVAGHAGQAAVFDGPDGGYFVLDDDPRLGGMGLLTISVWARKRTADAGGTVLLKHVYYALGLGADTIDAYVQTADGGIDLDAYHYAAIADAEWHHYLLRYDARTGSAELLVDGVVAASGTGSGFVRWEACDPRELVVGKDPWGDTFAGEIDELLLYDGWLP
jgi:hypothetical protein